MNIYYIIFCILASFAFFDSINVKESQRKYILIFSVLLLIIFATFRENVGFQDYDEYIESYLDVVKNGLWSENYTSSAAIFEYGFVLIYYLSSLVSSNPVWGLFVIATIGVTICLVCYKQYTKYFILAVLLYFVHTFVLREMIQIRAGVAAAICLYSLRFIEKQLVWKFIISILVAMSFHLASIIFSLVYILYKLNWSRKTWAIIVMLSVGIGLIMPFGQLLSNIPFLGPRINAYMWMIGDAKLGIFNNPTIIKQLFIVTIGLIFWKRLNEKVPSFKLFFIPLIISSCWICVWNDFPIIAGRMGTFFSITEVIIIPSFLYLFSDKSKPIVCVLIVLYAFMTLFLNIQTGNFIMYQGSSPY